jgi:hypothetical protein
MVTEMSPIHSHSHGHLEKSSFFRPLEFTNIKILKAAFGTKAKR